MFGMKKHIPFILLASVLALTGCTINPTTDQEETKETGEEEEVEYAVWPTEDVAIVVMGIDKDSKEVIPAFTKASEIKIDWNLYLSDGYFGIYCKTEDANSENEYKTILKDAGWDVVETKSEFYFDAFSPYGDLWINFGYDSSYKELQIYVNKGMFIHWPTKVVAEYLHDLEETTTTVIPSIEATSYIVNLYDTPRAMAINIYGLENTSVAAYKTIVENAGWRVESSSSGDSYFAYSSDEKVKINFYYDEGKSEFNIDVFKYVKPAAGWPTDEINSVLEEMGVVGEIPSYQGKNNGFVVDPYGYPPAIFVYVTKGTEAKSANDYIQMLLELGYVQAGTAFHGQATVYNFPGYTFYLCAAFLDADTPCFTIEIYTESMLDKE